MKKKFKYIINFLHSWNSCKPTGFAILNWTPSGYRAILSRFEFRFFCRQTNRLNVIGKLNWLLQLNQSDIIIHQLIFTKVFVDRPILNKNFNFRILINFRMMITESNKVGTFWETNKTMCCSENMIFRNNNCTTPMWWSAISSACSNGSLPWMMTSFCFRTTNYTKLSNIFTTIFSISVGYFDMAALIGIVWNWNVFVVTWVT